MGSATKCDKCRCEAPNTVVLEESTPICKAPELVCSGVEECSEFTLDPRWILCEDGRCVCRESFMGSARLLDKCRCEVPSVIVYEEDVARCIVPLVPLMRCHEQWECSNVTMSFNFVECLNGSCQCRKEDGFSGDATLESPCSCREPNSVVFLNDKAFCHPSTNNSNNSNNSGSLKCKEQWECNEPGKSVTLDYNYVQCLDGSCVCRVSQGFFGLATREDPCRCSSNKTITWVNGTAFCADIASLAPIESTLDPATAQTCEFQWQCGSVTDVYPAMDCKDGRCTCRNDLGFSGNGNSSHRCACLEPRHIEWIQNVPYCVQLIEGMI